MFSKVKDAWNYSRTIFLNVASFSLLGANEIISYLTGANWASIIDNPKKLFFVTLAINVMNVWLRMITTTPVGGKDSQ